MAIKYRTEKRNQQIFERLLGVFLACHNPNPTLLITLKRFMDAGSLENKDTNVSFPVSLFVWSCLTHTSVRVEKTGRQIAAFLLGVRSFVLAHSIEISSSVVITNSQPAFGT